MLGTPYHYYTEVFEMRKIFFVLVMVCVIDVFMPGSSEVMNAKNFIELCTSGTPREIEAAIKSGGVRWI